eukprot:CAMPEP_0183403998 /NCGR_PEP_ID=MMETSP0370-20130417/14920_1 /TAXON_ID=268820 /ORGANISM="Peridinium aciculiferum, Strain PAER-2" /LENGTH=383 /DNA_ID=CAMNT_0025585811 /DNA_START=1 /DNA_END=1152 /DNA_ORIENTATION=-
MRSKKPFESAASELVPETEHPLEQLRLLEEKAQELGRAGDVDAVVECRMKQLALHKVLVHLYDFPVRDLVLAQAALAEAYADGGYSRQAQDHLAKAKEACFGGVHDDGQAQRLHVDLLIAEGSVQLAVDELDLARRSLEQAARIGFQVFGEYTPRGARIHRLSGLLAQRQKRLQDAANAFQMAARIHESLDGAEHEETLRWRLRAAEALYLAQKHGEALEEQRRAIQDLQTSGVLPAILIDALSQMARWLEGAGREHDSSALESLKSAEQVADQELDKEDPKVVEIKRDIALLQLKMGNTDIALEYLQEVEYLERRLHGSQSTNVARTLKALGTVHMVRHNMEDSERCFQMALRIFEAASPPNKDIIRDIRAKLNSILAASNA